MFWCTKNVKFQFRWGKKPRDQKQEAVNDCDVISGLKVSGKTDFSEIFLSSYKKLTFVPFPGESISFQKENDWEICFLLRLKSLQYLPQNSRIHFVRLQKL